MVDITQPLKLVDSTPEVAAKNIEDANLLNLGANVYKNFKDQLQPQVDAAKIPGQAEPKVADFVSQSPEHAAVIKNDIEHMNYFERQVNLISDYVGKRRTNTNELIDLNLKKMWHPDQMSVDDHVKIGQLNEDVKSYDNYGIDGPYEQIPAQIAGAIAGIGDVGVKNAAIIAGGTTAGGVLGALTGNPVAVGVGMRSGFVLTSTGVMAARGFDSQSALVYNELSSPEFKTPNGQPLDDSTKKYLSVGTGLISAGLTAFAGKAIATTVPFLAPFFAPKAMQSIVMDPAKSALRATLMNIGKSVSISGVAGAAQEITTVMAEELGHTGGSFSEAQFVDALTKASDRIAKNAVVAGGTALAIAAPGARSQYKTSLSNFITTEEAAVNNARNVNPDAPLQIEGGPKSTIPSDIPPDGILPPPHVDEAVQAVHLDTALTNIQQVAKSTKLMQLSKDSLNALRKSIFEDTDLRYIFADPTDLNKFASDAEKSARVKALMVPSDITPDNTNAPVQIDTHKFLELMDDYPQAKDMIKLSPEAMNISKAKEYLANIQATREKGQKILKDLQAKVADGSMTEEEAQKVLDKAQFNVQDFVHPDVTDEAQYIAQPIFTDAIASILPEGTKAKIESSQRAVKLEVAQDIQSKINKEYQQVVDVNTYNAMEDQKDSEFAALENHVGLNIADKFKTTSAAEAGFKFLGSRIVDDLTEAHQEKGFSPFAIDPRTLPDHLKELVKNKQLKKQKVFVKGGITAEQAAQMLGVQSGEVLLNILKDTPTRQQLAEIKAEKHRQSITNEAADISKPTEDNLKELFGNKFNNIYKEMKLLKEQDWSGTKAGIKTIGLALPIPEQIKYEGKQAVQKLTVGELNPNRFKAGERRSAKMALEDILKNDVLKAYMNKEAQLLNIVLQQETHLAIGRVNRVFKFARRFKKPEIIQELKDAGPLYYDAVNEILGAFKLDPSKRNMAEAGSFAKWAEKMAETGEGNFDIPERLSNVAMPGRDMTVEQIALVGDRLKTILYKAKKKNQLYNHFELVDMAENQDSIAAVLHEQAITLNSYDLQKTELKDTADMSNLERADAFFMGGLAIVERAEHLTTQLDGGKVAGLYTKTLVLPIKNGEAAKGRDMISARNQIEKMVNNYGAAEFEDLNSQFVQVPEFKDISALNHGNISKGKLLAMVLNMGNEGNLKALENFGVSRDTVKVVVERHLALKDAIFAQQVMDILESFKPKVAALEIQTNGVEPEWIDAKPHELFGRQFPGGYYRIFYDQKDTLKSIGEELIGTVEMNQMKKIYNPTNAQAMTKQGHLDSRTGSGAFLDLSLNNIGEAIEQVIHDIHLRVPIRDTARLLAHHEIRQDIAANLGVKSFNQIANMVKDSARSVQMRNEADKIVLSYLNKLGGGEGFQAVMILGKATSIAVQPVTILSAINQMGKGGRKIGALNHILYVLKSMGGNPTTIKQFVDLAADVHPPILETRENIDTYAANSINRLMPKKNHGKYLNPIARGLEFATDIGWSALETADQFAKTVVVLAAHRQALQGDVPHIKKGDVQAAKEYAGSIARLTQTHGAISDKSAIQKSAFAKPILLFYNDGNNLLNNVIGTARQGREDYQNAKDQFQSGDTKKAAGTTIKGIGAVLSTMLIWSTMQMIENLIRSRPTPLDDANDMKSAKEWTAFYLNSNVDQIAGSVPILRDINFAADQQNKPTKTVNLPINRQLSDFATALSGLKSILSLNGDNDVSDEEMRAILYSAGYLTKFPSDAVYKYLIQPEYDTPVLLKKSSWRDLGDKIDSFLKKNETAQNSDEIPPELLEDLKNIRDVTKPAETAQNDTVTPENLKIIRAIESGFKKNDWQIKNPDSSAAGLYQFTEGTWRDIIDRSGLALTEAGRTSKNTTQQESAMEWYTNQNIKELKASDVEITPEHIYAAHFLGAEAAIKVLGSVGENKLAPLVGESVMKANPQLKGFTVDDFEAWLKKKVKMGRSMIDKAPQQLEAKL